MAIGSSQGITELLGRWRKGDEEALDQLMPLVYEELRRLAGSYLRRERREHTLQPTALVNEAYLKLVHQREIPWQNRAQFFGIAAKLMRQILVDHARAHGANKRGGHQVNVSLKNIGAFYTQGEADVLAVHDVLNRLAEIDPDQSRIVELRFFGGLTIEETGEVMKVSHSTVEREWRIAKAWLKRELSNSAKSS